MNAPHAVPHLRARRLPAPFSVALDPSSPPRRPRRYTRHNFDANISHQLLADYYWPAFRSSIREAKAKGVMCSYNSVNGQPACASPLLKAAREAWGFDGYVTSDSDSVADVWKEHHYTPTAAQASCVAVHDGGCDIDSGNTYYDSLLEGVQSSAPGCAAASMTDVDRALFNSLRVRFDLGLFDPKERNPYWSLGADDIGTDASRALSRRAASESLVLLQNPMRRGGGGEAVLPLTPGVRVAVLGPHGNASHSLIQVDTGRICADGTMDCVQTPLAAISELNGAAGGSTSYAEGCDLTRRGTSGFAAALAAAKAAEVVVLGLGISSCGNWWHFQGRPCAAANATNGMAHLEAEGHDRTSIDLPAEQHALVRRRDVRRTAAQVEHNFVQPRALHRDERVRALGQRGSVRAARHFCFYWNQLGALPFAEVARAPMQVHAGSRPAGNAQFGQRCLVLQLWRLRHLRRGRRLQPDLLGQRDLRNTRRRLRTAPAHPRRTPRQ